MKNHIMDIVMTSIMQKADSHLDDPNATLAISIESLSTIAEYAADGIMDVMEMYAQKQWDAEYEVAHMPQ